MSIFQRTVRALTLTMWPCACLCAGMAAAQPSSTSSRQAQSDGDAIPTEWIQPSKAWRSGAIGATTFFDRSTGKAQAPTGAAQVLHFEKNGPGTLRQETFLQAGTSYGDVRASLTSVDGTVTVGSVTDDEGVTAKTLTFQAVRGEYRIMNNGQYSTRPISPEELRSSKFSGKTYAVVRKTDPNYGRPQEVLLLIDLGSNKKVDNSDTVTKFVAHQP